MKRYLSSALGALTLAAVPAYAFDGASGDFESVFITVFLAYCALIVVSQLAEFVKLLLTRKSNKKQHSICELSH